MSYERKMRSDHNMPSNEEVEDAILLSLMDHEGHIKEFSAGEDIVNEIADRFTLSELQRSVILERVYRKENRIVKSLLWHRLVSSGKLIV